METRQLFKNFVWFLTFILVFSPISFAVSANFISHADMQHKTTSFTSSIDSNHHMPSSDHKTNLQINDSDETCQTECANCVYCSASNFTSDVTLLVFYSTANPEIIKYFSKSINPSVDIRPPISL